MSARRSKPRLLILVAVVVLGVATSTSASAQGSVRPGARVGLVGVFHNGETFHIGDTLGYNVLVVDNARRSMLAARAVKFFLVASGRTIPLRSMRYKSYFWYGHVAIPAGVSGKARVRADVVAAGRRFRALSYWFTVAAPVTAVEVAKAQSSGDKALAVATGDIQRPADGYVFASAKTAPSQPVDMHWNVSCVYGSATSSSSGSAQDGGPGTIQGDLVIEKVQLPIANADSCTISFSAQLSDWGAVKVDILGNSWK